MLVVVTIAAGVTKYTDGAEVISKEASGCGGTSLSSPALGRLRQEDDKFKVSLGHRERDQDQPGQLSGTLS